MAQAKKVVRHCSKKPTPYLKYLLEHKYLDRARNHVAHLYYEDQCLVYDLGAGRNRNTTYLAEQGFNVVPLDMAPQGDVLPWIAGRDRICEKSRGASLVLCQYLLMFLTKAERVQLYLEIDRVAAFGGFLLVELEDVKSGHRVSLKEIKDWFISVKGERSLTPRQLAARNGLWRTVHERDTKHLLMQKST